MPRPHVSLSEYGCAPSAQRCRNSDRGIENRQRDACSASASSYRVTDLALVSNEALRLTSLDQFEHGRSAASSGHGER